MQAVKVEYAVSPDFTEQNKTNIKSVMRLINSGGIDGIAYTVATVGDGNTFVHLNIANSPEQLKKFTDSAEFKAFQSALKASQPVSPPVVTELSIVGTANAL